MFRSIWFWVILILLGAALWFGRDTIASYFDKLPMQAQERTTDTQELATTSPSSTTSSYPVAAGANVTSTPTLSAKAATPTKGSGTPQIAAASVPTETSKYTTYVVQKGDTLYSIAQKHHTTVDHLQSINGIDDPSSLFVGQELKVPAPPSVSTPTRPAPKPGTTTYTVQKGDTLSSIARKFNTSVSELQKLNNFSNPNNLVVGSVILVPAPSNPRPTTSPPPPSSPPVASPSSSQPGDGEVQTMPVVSTTSPTGSGPTPLPTAPPATPTPTPIPTVTSVCGGAQDAVFVWGVSFCVPPGWDLQEYAAPYRTALLTKSEESGDLSIYAISRMDGAPHAPLSWSMRQAKKSVSTEISSLIPGGLAEPENWTLATGLRIADVEGQMSEAQSAYLKTGHAAHVRVVVFNHADQRWRIVAVAPQALWQEYNVTVFPFIARTLDVY